MSKSNFNFMGNNDLINCYYKTEMKLYAQRAEKEVYHDPILSIQYSKAFLIYFLKGIIFQEKLKRFIESTDNDISKYIEIIKTNTSLLPSFCFDTMNEILKINDLIQQKDSKVKKSAAINNALKALQDDFYLAVLFTGVYYYLPPDKLPKYHQPQPSKQYVSDEKEPLDRKYASFSIMKQSFSVIKQKEDANFQTIQKPIQLSPETKAFRVQMITQHLQHLFTSTPLSSKGKTHHSKINKNSFKHFVLNEQETRLLIDEQLRHAGWKADTEKYNYWTNKTLPKANENIAIAEWPCEGDLRADYALFCDCKLVGIVEAKKYDKDIPGDLSQAKDYARTVCVLPGTTLAQAGSEYRVPFIYSTNGRSFVQQLKTKSGIWFWNAMQSFYPAKPLVNWHTPQDLLQKLQVNVPAAEEYLAHDSYYPDFANRTYQIQAIQAVEHALAQKQDKILVAMATGTGKTRMALSLIYRLLKSKRAYHILYLVDRNDLVRQTYDVCHNVTVNGYPLNRTFIIADNECNKDRHTQLYITTIQSMIRQTSDYNQSSHKPTVGEYDLIIVDEAHRGYIEDKQMSENEIAYENAQDYLSKYRRVLDYFDAPKIALTATPTIHTVEIFGKPVYTYSYKDAVTDGFLADCNPPIKIKTKLSQDGIHFKRGELVQRYNLTKQTIEEGNLPDDLDFDVDKFNRKVITLSFNEAVADALVKMIDPNDPEAGKTLIFAVNDHHADMVVDCLKRAYQKAGILIKNNVIENAIEKITGTIRHQHQEINRFKTTRGYPNIVVTVDLLTTGIDVPSITNIVFLRQVHSRVLYEQMLGRATRLCPDIHKEAFNIYDAVNLCDQLKDVTDIKPVVKRTKLANLLENIKNTSKMNESSDQQSQDSFEWNRNQIIVRLQRHRLGISDEKIHEAEEVLHVNSIEEWLRSLKQMSAAEFLKQIKNIQYFIKIPTVSCNYQYISNVKDEVVSVEQEYKSENKATKDYLESFKKFIEENQDKYQALQIAINHPSDLTRKDLHEIESQLSKNGYSEHKLQVAWQKATNQKMIVDIISFIRNVAKGIPIHDKNERVRQAMQKVYQLTDWSSEQKRWLKRIEEQLLANDVPILGPNAKIFFDNSIFANSGGYQRMHSIFKDQTDQIVIVLNQALYATTSV